VSPPHDSVSDVPATYACVRACVCTCSVSSERCSSADNADAVINLLAVVGDPNAHVRAVCAFALCVCLMCSAYVSMHAHAVCLTAHTRTQ
jgi:hypothetical protein